MSKLDGFKPDARVQPVGPTPGVRPATDRKAPRQPRKRPTPSPESGADRHADLDEYA